MTAPPAGRNRHITSRFLRVAVACLAVASIAWLILRSLKPISPAIPLPSPNGHDDFVAAGQSLVGTGFDPKTATIEQMRDYASSNTAALSRLRLGLSRPARVPVEFTLDYSGRRVDEFTSLKRLTTLVLAEGEVLAADHRIADALGSGLDALRFSHESVRGGLLIDMLVGVACEAKALGSLERVVSSLDATQCRRAILVIQELDRWREPTAEILARERVWCRRVWGWRGTVAGLLPAQRQAEQKAASKRHQIDRQREAVLIRLGCRACRLETGKAPSGWEDLVPRYLEKIPTDPGTGEPLPLDPGTAE